MGTEVQVSISKCYYAYSYASHTCGQYTCVECKGESSFRSGTGRISKCFKAHSILSSQSLFIPFLPRRLYNLTYPQPKLGRYCGRKCMEKPYNQRLDHNIFLYRTKFELQVTIVLVFPNFLTHNSACLYFFLVFVYLIVTSPHLHGIYVLCVYIRAQQCQFSVVHARTIHG